MAGAPNTTPHQTHTTLIAHAHTPKADGDRKYRIFLGASAVLSLWIRRKVENTSMVLNERKIMIN